MVDKGSTPTTPRRREHLNFLLLLEKRRQCLPCMHMTQTAACSTAGSQQRLPQHCRSSSAHASIPCTHALLVLQFCLANVHAVCYCLSACTACCALLQIAAVLLLLTSWVCWPSPRPAGTLQSGLSICRFCTLPIQSCGK